MAKIAIIGAGSITFTRRLVMDIMTVPELQETAFSFMDISEEYLERVTKLMRKILNDNGITPQIEPTMNQREAISSADYVISVARVGGLDAFAKDIEIPLKYGVDQCVGDTLGPGGVFYALRTIPVLLDIASDMRELAAPGALFLNYSNPMAMNCWAVRRAGGVRIIGLCHGVQNGHQEIAEALRLPPEEVDYVCAGINHQTWYIQVTHKGKDMLPFLVDAFETHPELSEHEKVRIDIMKRFGAYSTESNGHLSEYLPWYRKRPDEIGRWISYDSWIHGPTAGYLNHVREMAGQRDEYVEQYVAGELETLKLDKRSQEHASYIIEALETGRVYRGHFNIANTGLISNLPDGCTVELPCYVDANGITPGWNGDLPQQCAASCRASISVQEMAVEAALTGNRELVRLAVLHDPLTGAVLNTEEVWAMCDEMFEELAPWMPQFNGQGRTWSDIPLPDGGRYRFPRPAGNWRPPALSL